MNIDKRNGSTLKYRGWQLLLAPFLYIGTVKALTGHVTTHIRLHCAAYAPI